MPFLITGIVALLMAMSTPSQLYQLELEFAGVEQAQGSIRVALYANEEGFLQGAAGFREDRIPLSQPAVYRYAFRDVPSGKYAIAAYHDLNDNGELDTNVFGIPKEPYAFSKNPAVKWRAPTFTEVSFDLSGPGEEKQRLVLKKWGKH